MRFRPALCPRPDCPSLLSDHHRWRHKGRFQRRCDGRSVQRFLCLECRRTFSTQTFRLDYRQQNPQQSSHEEVRHGATQCAERMRTTS